MMTLTVADQLNELRRVLFEAVDEWNNAHPHPLRSHHERGSVSITQIYTDSSGVPSYAVNVVCALAGTGQLAFHGTDLCAVIEHARLTVERRIAVEIARRAERAHDHEFEQRYAVAV